MESLMRSNALAVGKIGKHSDVVWSDEDVGSACAQTISHCAFIHEWRVTEIENIDPFSFLILTHRHLHHRLLHHHLYKTVPYHTILLNTLERVGTRVGRGSGSCCCSSSRSTSSGSINHHWRPLHSFWSFSGSSCSPLPSQSYSHWLGPS